MRLRIKDNSVPNGIARESVDFSRKKMRLTGAPKEKKFNISILAPYSSSDGGIYSTDVEVLSCDAHDFEVKYVNPSKEFIVFISRFKAEKVA